MRKRWMTGSVWVSLFFLVLSMPLSGAIKKAADWEVKAAKTRVQAGEVVELKITATIIPGWHIYSTKSMGEGPVPTTINLAKNDVVQLEGKPVQPKPVTHFDDNFGINVEYHENSVTFGQKVTVLPTARPGAATFEVTVNSMACNDAMCLPPSTVSLPVKLEILPGKGKAIPAAGVTETAPTPPSPPNSSTSPAPAASPATPAASTVSDSKESSQTPKVAETKASKGNITDSTGALSGSEEDVKRAKKEGFWAFIGLAMAAGLAAVFTPCVFPMIPITVSFFTKRKTATRMHCLRDATIYSSGIIFTFTGLGLLMAIFLGAAGINKFAANPWVNMFIAAIFIGFALNLFGMFEIAIPSSVLTKLSSSSGGGGGVISLLLMGFTFTLTSFTCTVPFVGTVLISTAQGDYFWPILGMMAFAFTFSLPFFFLALFPAVLKALPKSGGWLNSLKVVMGFLELAAATKFISNVDLVWNWGILSRDTAICIWVAIGLTTVFYLLGKFLLPLDTPVEKIGVPRLIFALFFMSITVSLCTGIGGKTLGIIDAYLPPSSSELTWHSNYEEALKVARKENRNIFIDFTGYACTNCRWMESNIFPRPEIRSLLDKYVLVQLYTDGSDASNRDFQEKRFGTVALPYYVVVSPTGEELANYPGLTKDPNAFRKFLERNTKK